MIPICPHTLLRLDYTSQFGQQWHTRLPIVTLNYFVLQHKLRQENTQTLHLPGHGLPPGSPVSVLRGSP